MRKTLGAIALAALPLLATASDVQISIDKLKIQSGGTTISIGERDQRGYYWDGKTWRDPVYWNKYHAKPAPPAPPPGPAKGLGYHCPPGQAKKGNC